jgi:hypothetical protein
LICHAAASRQILRTKLARLHNNPGSAKLRIAAYLSVEGCLLERNHCNNLIRLTLGWLQNKNLRHVFKTFFIFLNHFGAFNFKFSKSDDKAQYFSAVVLKAEYYADFNYVKKLKNHLKEIIN